MELSFDQRVARVITRATPLRAAVVDENEVRAAAGVTMAIGAVAFAYAYFTKQYIPLQVVASFFFLEFLVRVTAGIRYSPMGVLARGLTWRRAAGVGLSEAEAVRVDARAGDDLRDDGNY